VSGLFLYYASNNSLFAVPANQEFVYIRPQSQDQTGDLVKFYLDQLHNSCQMTQTGWFLLRESYFLLLYFMRYRAADSGHYSLFH